MRATDDQRGGGRRRPSSIAGTRWYWTVSRLVPVILIPSDGLWFPHGRKMEMQKTNKQQQKTLQKQKYKCQKKLSSLPKQKLVSRYASSLCKPHAGQAVFVTVAGGSLSVQNRAVTCSLEKLSGKRFSNIKKWLLCVLLSCFSNT